MRFVWPFAESPAAGDHLGVRGRMMRDLSRLGMPVPTGFTVADLACRRFLGSGELPAPAWDEIVAATRRLADEAVAAGRPLLLAVRSSPPVPMPGMLAHALHVGMTGPRQEKLALWASTEVAAAARIGFLHGLAGLRRVPAHRVEAVAPDPDAMEALIVEESQRAVPADAPGQLREAIEAVFASWDATPARRWRRRHGIADEVGTAAVVHAMMLGSVGEHSGSGVAFSRHPETGHPQPVVGFAPGADRPPKSDLGGFDEMAAAVPEAAGLLHHIVSALEHELGDLARVDFVVERGDLWLIEARPGERSARAAVQIAVDLVHEGRIDRVDALLRVDPAGLEDVLHDRLLPGHPSPIATGSPTSPGAASGGIAFTAADAQAAGPAILVMRETSPEDLAGVVAAAGLLTSHGGGTSHGAVVARGTGTAAVTAAEIAVDAEVGEVRIGGSVFRAGDLLTIDGTTGAVYAGSLPIERATASEALETLLGWADGARRLEVWANADRPGDAALARASGAEGIGLVRTEYMFSGERLDVVRQIILADDERERSTALGRLEVLQIGDFERLLAPMDGLSLVVRLLDPPLHEFLPDRREVERQLRAAAGRGEDTAALQRLRAAVDQFEESNPMLGLRGVRLAVVIPEIYRVQVLAALESVRRRLDQGGDPRLELMIPLVGTVEELHLIRDIIDEEVHYAGRQLEVTVGTMIELPRAALVAGQLALQSDFFSFGTNDLTQTTLGISRDDAEEAFLRTYLEQGIMRHDPFATIDREGVGRLIELAIADGRRVNPELVVGVCGEHGGDPASIEFFHGVGVDYVSCSIPRLPIARLAAAQAALRAG
jgi:pyruvate, orthophosphate dikinase